MQLVVQTKLLMSVLACKHVEMKYVQQHEHEDCKAVSLVTALCYCLLERVI